MVHHIDSLKGFETIERWMNMNSKELALLGCLIPLFFIVEEISLVLPVPTAFALLFIFRGIRSVAFYAYGIATFMGFLLNSVIIFGNIIMLIIYLYNIVLEGSGSYILWRNSLEFKNRDLEKVGYFWVLVTVVFALSIAGPLFIGVELHSLFFVLLWSAFGIIIQCLLLGICFRVIFNRLRKWKLDEVSKQIDMLLFGFVGTVDNSIELQMEQFL